MAGMFFKCLNDEHQTIIYASPGALELTGYTSQELVLNTKISLGAMVYFDDNIELREKRIYNLTHKLSSTYEYRFFCRSGKLKLVKEISNGIYDEDGKLLFIEGYIKDISETKGFKESMETLNAYQGAVNKGSVVSITDANGRIIYANDRFCEISKYNRNELIGKKHDLINSGYHSKGFFEEMWKTISSGKPWRAEIKNKAKDGSFYWVDSVITPLINGKKEIIQYLSVRNLITEKKNLEESQISFRQAIDTSSDSIFMIDSKKMVFVDMNERATKDLGYSKEELLHMGPHELTPEFSKQVLQQKLEAFMQTQNRFGIIETVHRKKNGECMNVEIHFKGLRAADKKHILIASVRDITQRKKTIEDLQENKDFHTTVLSALSSNIVVIDNNGIIISVNDNWMKFAKENNAGLKDIGIGINYLKVCIAAIKDGDFYAKKITFGN